MDIDLVNMYFANRKQLTTLMEELGFKEQGRHFIHVESPYCVEFPPGPLAVGREPIKEILSFPLKTGVLNVISPTDCIKDRLLAFFYWDNQQCLEQARLIAASYPPDWTELVSWAIAEDSLDKYRKIESYLHPEP